MSSYIEGVEPRISYFLGRESQFTGQKATVASFEHTAVREVRIFEHTAVRAGQDLCSWGWWKASLKEGERSGPRARNPGQMDIFDPGSQTP